MLDRTKFLWYDYSIIIGKKSAFLQVGLLVADAKDRCDAFRADSCAW
ncbi:MAG: hypothetical protein IJW49_07460 [Clostridia bacterium]|nr:hypothetical protein [Clostridia bacterium]